jgi:hypothetical protein
MNATSAYISLIPQLTRRPSQDQLLTVTPSTVQDIGSIISSSLMSDPFSISAGIVGIVTATAHVIRKTIDLIDKIEDAPSLVCQIRSELDHTEPVIRSLEKRLESSVETVVWAQLFEESKLSKALDTTRTVCENFASALRKWTRHSPPGNKLSLRDGFAIAIHGSKIAQLMKQLNSCKLTVTMALTSCAV